MSDLDSQNTGSSSIIDQNRFDKNQKTFAPIDMDIFNPNQTDMPKSKEILNELKSSKDYKSMDEIINEQLGTDTEHGAFSDRK